MRARLKIDFIGARQIFPPSVQSLSQISKYRLLMLLHNPEPCDKKPKRGVQMRLVRLAKFGGEFAFVFYNSLGHDK